MGWGRHTRTHRVTYLDAAVEVGVVDFVCLRDELRGERVLHHDPALLVPVRPLSSVHTLPETSYGSAVGLWYAVRGRVHAKRAAVLLNFPLLRTCVDSHPPRTGGGRHPLLSVGSPLPSLPARMPAGPH
eukprot:COSAG03_NODE_990_length_5091_cov_465.421474_5_plen_129_part_00